MKKIVGLLMFFLSFFIFANELKIQKIRLIKTMTYDKNDKYRYSPLKMFDKKNDTAFAVPLNETYDDLVLILHFDKEYEFDEINISAGYFDSKWYLKNYRIKEINFIFNYNDTGSDKLKESFILKDEMVSQKLKFSEKRKAKDIWIKARSYYPSSAYDDVCISEMSFNNNGKEYDIVIRPARNFYGSKYEYDIEGNLVKETICGDHLNYDLNYYRKDNQFIGKCEYIDEDNVPQQFDYKKITYLKNVIEIVIGRNYIKHYYDNKKLLRSEVTNYNGEKYNLNYYYKNGILDHTDYGEFIYENGLLKAYIAYDHYYHSSPDDYVTNNVNKEFCSYYLEYNEKNQVIKRTVWSFSGYSAVR